MMDKRESEEESDFIGFSPIKEKVSSESDIEQANALARQLHVYKPGIEFVPGSKLEVLDSRDNKWYLCKVVEVDWGELDILVHYERWSVRFDEWLKMDSTRIRPVCHAPPRRENKRAFKVGENVLGFWNPDCKMYPAQIVRQISDDFWNVLFFDGITKALRTSQIKKLNKKNTEPKGNKFVKSSSSSTSQSDVTFISTSESNLKALSKACDSSKDTSTSDQNKKNIFDVKILKEKRKTIRKPDVEELFQSIKKRKKSETYHSEVSIEADEEKSSVNLALEIEKEQDSFYTIDIKVEPDTISEQGDISTSAKLEDVIDITEEKKVLQKKPKTPKITKEKLSSNSLTLTDANHLCPEKGCEKSFRKENLLQMHLKHYHPSVLKRKSLQAPNVADLAYARTVGDHLDAEETSNNSPVAEPPASSSERVLKRFSRSFLGFESKGISNPADEESLELSISDIDDDELEMPSDLDVEKNEDEEGFNETTETISADTNDPDYVPEAPQKEKPLQIEEKKQKPKKSEDADDELVDSCNEPCDAENDASAIINCKCHCQEEDGLMLQCDICLCWQHGSCYNIENENQVPEKYICSLCENPKGLHSSMKFRHHQEWLKDGKLPRFSFSQNDRDVNLESSIQKGQDLLANILQLSPLIHSLRLKLRISKHEDHPKFVMWFKKWCNTKDDSDKENQVEGAPISSVINALEQVATPPLSTDSPNNALLPFEQNKYATYSSLETTKESMPLSPEEKMLTSTNSAANPDSIIKEVDEKDGISSANLIESKSDIPIKDENFKAFDIKEEKESFGEAKKSNIDDHIKKEQLPDAFAPSDLQISSKDPPRVNLDDPSMDLEFDDFLSSEAELEQLVRQEEAVLPSLVTPEEQPSPSIPIIPETERIEPMKCKLNLLKHVEAYQDAIFDRFSYLESQIQALETKMGLSSQFTKEEEDLFSSESQEARDPVTLQARSLVKLVCNDLDSVCRMTNYASPY